MGKTPPHRLILKNVGPEYDGEAEYLRVTAESGAKIELGPANPDYLITEYGLGYRFGRQCRIDRHAKRAKP